MVRSPNDSKRITRDAAGSKSGGVAGSGIATAKGVK